MSTMMFDFSGQDQLALLTFENAIRARPPLSGEVNQTGANPDDRNVAVE
jgi:hypothetical protein